MPLTSMPIPPSRNSRKIRESSFFSSTSKRIEIGGYPPFFEPVNVAPHHYGSGPRGRKRCQVRGNGLGRRLFDPCEDPRFGFLVHGLRQVEEHMLPRRLRIVAAPDVDSLAKVEGRELGADTVLTDGVLAHVPSRIADLEVVVKHLHVHSVAVVADDDAVDMLLVLTFGFVEPDLDRARLRLDRIIDHFGQGRRQIEAGVAQGHQGLTGEDHRQAVGAVGLRDTRVNGRHINFPCFGGHRLVGQKPHWMLKTPRRGELTCC